MSSFDASHGAAFAASAAKLDSAATVSSVEEIYYRPSAAPANGKKAEAAAEAPALKAVPAKAAKPLELPSAKAVKKGPRPPAHPREIWAEE